MTSRDKSDTRPLHESLLDDLEQMLAIYDQSVQLMLEAVRHDGYFDDLNPDAVVWPKSQSGAMDMEALQFRAQLVDAIFQGLPEVRDRRLDEAYRPFAELLPQYHTGSRIYLQLRRQFVERGRGDAKDFLRLYQSLYLKALAQAELHAPGAVEEALAQVHITQVPMSHARAVAEALSNVEADEGTHWTEEYSCERDGERIVGTLRDLLQDVAQRTLNLIAAGGLLSTRYNYLTNFGWFGVSVWKVIVDAEVALAQLRETSDVDLDGIDGDVLHIKALLIEFLHVHQEDPTKLRPRLYWYGQEYSYLTRDMIDLSVRLICDVNAQIDRVGQKVFRVWKCPLCSADTGAEDDFWNIPMSGVEGNFQSCSEECVLPGGWGLRSEVGRPKKKLLEREADPIRRREAGWRTWLDWGRRTLDIFDIRVDIYFDPHFEAIVRDLGADAEDPASYFFANASEFV